MSFLLGIPKIKKFAFEENVKEGDFASATCIAISNEKPLSFSWSKNHQEIHSSSKGTKINGGEDYSILMLNEVSIEDDGNYTCKVENSRGSVTYSAALSVKGK